MNLAWFGNTVSEIDVCSQPVPAPQGDLVGLAPTKQIPKPPQIEI